MAKKSESSQAVDYAENTLGVHDTFAVALDGLTIFEESADLYADFCVGVRRAEEDMAQREAELIMQFRTANPDWSEAKMEKGIRLLVQTDAVMVAHRARLRDVRSERDRAELDMKRGRIRCEIASARLIELGGLLNFYAAAKQPTKS